MIKAAFFNTRRKIMSSNETKRFLVPGNDQDRDAIMRGYCLVHTLNERYSSDVDHVILLIPVKENIRGGTLQSVLGEKISNSLFKGEEVFLNKSGKPMRLKTMRTLDGNVDKSIVFAVYADWKMMDKTEKMDNLFAIVAVPCNDDSLDHWKDKWSPVIFEKAANNSKG
ncbi:MAG: hypothetical protein D3924_19545 [Candidatus Electrothrix sp. AR4]|nr:hypothetical protein [Candidatus Electrothrix sp. AR4]